MCVRDPKGQLHGEWGRREIHSTAVNSPDSEGEERPRSRCVRSYSLSVWEEVTWVLEGLLWVQSSFAGFQDNEHTSVC